MPPLHTPQPGGKPPGPPFGGSGDGVGEAFVGLSVVAKFKKTSGRCYRFMRFYMDMVGGGSLSEGVTAEKWIETKISSIYYILLEKSRKNFHKTENENF